MGGRRQRGIRVLVRVTAVLGALICVTTVQAARADAPGESKLLQAFQQANYGQASGGHLGTRAQVESAEADIAAVPTCSSAGNKAKQLMLDRLRIAALNDDVAALARQIQAKQQTPSYIASPAHVADLAALARAREAAAKALQDFAASDQQLNTLLRQLQTSSCDAAAASKPASLAKGSGGLPDGLVKLMLGAAATGTLAVAGWAAFKRFATPAQVAKVEQEAAYHDRAVADERREHARAVQMQGEATEAIQKYVQKVAAENADAGAPAPSAGTSGNEWVLDAAKGMAENMPGGTVAGATEEFGGDLSSDTAQMNSYKEQWLAERAQHYAYLGNEQAASDAAQSDWSREHGIAVGGALSIQAGADVAKAAVDATEAGQAGQLWDTVKGWFTPKKK